LPIKPSGLDFVCWKFFVCLFLLFTTTPVAYGSPKLGAKSELQLLPQPQQRQIQAMSVTYTTAHDSARYLTHWVRPGIEATSLWTLVEFIYAAPQQELQLPVGSFFSHIFNPVLVIGLFIFSISS